MDRKPFITRLTTPLIASLVVSSSLVTAAHAQAPTKAAAQAQAQAQTAAPAAAAPAPAPAAPVTPEQRAAIRELLDVTHTRDALSAVLQQMSQGLRPQMGQLMMQRIETNTSLSADQKQKVRASMDPPFESAVNDGTKMINDPKVIDDVLDRMVVVYARTFTVDELKQLNAFYKSPLGQKALSAVPTASREAMQGMMATLAPKLSGLAEATVQKQIDLVVKGDAPAKAAAPTKK